MTRAELLKEITDYLTANSANERLGEWTRQNVIRLRNIVDTLDDNPETIYLLVNYYKNLITPIDQDEQPAIEPEQDQPELQEPQTPPEEFPSEPQPEEK